MFRIAIFRGPLKNVKCVEPYSFILVILLSLVLLKSSNKIICIILCLFSNRILAAVTSLAFTVFAALDSSYSATTPILASTLATCARVW